MRKNFSNNDGYDNDGDSGSMWREAMGKVTFKVIEMD